MGWKDIQINGFDQQIGSDFELQCDFSRFADPKTVTDSDFTKNKVGIANSKHHSRVIMDLLDNVDWF